MTRTLAYWILFLIWIVSAFSPMLGYSGIAAYRASEIILILLFALLGWQVYGPAIKS